MSSVRPFGLFGIVVLNNHVLKTRAKGRIKLTGIDGGCTKRSFLRSASGWWGVCAKRNQLQKLREAQLPSRLSGQTAGVLQCDRGKEAEMREWWGCAKRNHLKALREAQPPSLAFEQNTQLIISVSPYAQGWIYLCGGPRSIIIVYNKHIINYLHL